MGADMIATGILVPIDGVDWDEAFRFIDTAKSEDIEPGLGLDTGDFDFWLADQAVQDTLDSQATSVELRRQYCREKFEELRDAFNGRAVTAWGPFYTVPTEGETTGQYWLMVTGGPSWGDSPEAVDVFDAACQYPAVMAHAGLLGVDALRVDPSTDVEGRS